MAEQESLRAERVELQKSLRAELQKRKETDELTAALQSQIKELRLTEKMEQGRKQAERADRDASSPEQKQTPRPEETPLGAVAGDHSPPDNKGKWVFLPDNEFPPLTTSNGSPQPDGTPNPAHISPPALVFRSPVPGYRECPACGKKAR